MFHSNSSRRAFSLWATKELDSAHQTFQKQVVMKTIYLRLCLIGLLLCSVLTNTAQTPEWINLHKGNSAFKAGDMSTAEKAYRQALKANPHSARAAFNLGDVYLNKKDAQNALKFYEQAAKQEKSKLVRAMAYHNMGYIHHVGQEYDRAMNYYKDALRTIRRMTTRAII